MSNHYHAIVWIDHREAKVFQFNATDVDRTTVRSAHPDQHIHHKANSGDSGHAAVDSEFLKRVAEAIGPAHGVADGQAHVGQRQLGDRRPVDQFDH